MKVILARISGFCDGVKRATRIALAAASEGGVWADGPLVHNQQALSLISLHGVNVGDSPAPGDSHALIRAHGATPERRRQLAASGLEIVDATCVHVGRNQRLAARAAQEGATVLLAGDPDHAEVRAVAAAAGGRCRVVASVADIEGLDIAGPVLLLAQTTFNIGLFEAMAAAARARFPGCRVVDSICRATHDRQRETERIARLADVLVVVGGRHSANTRRLADTGLALGKPVFLVETASELRDADFAGYATAAVTSGASTPGWVTQEVVDRLLFMGRSTLSARLLGLVHTLAVSRALTALSAGGLALAAQAYLLEALEPALAVAGAGYVFFAHTLNRRIPADPEARRLSLVDAFYQSRRRPMLIVAWACAALSLGIAFWHGGYLVLLYALAVFAATLYASLVRRGDTAPGWAGVLRQAASLRHGIMSLGWALVLAGPPAWILGDPRAGGGAMLFVFLVCLGATLVRDLHDIASDRLMGIDTLPGRLGPLRAAKLATGVLGLAALLPFAAAAVSAVGGGTPAVWFAFLVCLPAAPGLGLHLLDQVRRHNVPNAVFLQAGLDGMGCLAGCLALAAGAMA